MSVREDLARVERLMKAANDGTLTDLAVFATLAMVRAEATLEERTRQAERLQKLGYRHLVRGERRVAEVLEDVAHGIELPPPPTPQ